MNPGWSDRPDARPDIMDEARIVWVREVARGGMSVVYEGRQLGYEGFGKQVAVKMLLDKWSGNARFLKLFIAEAKLVSDLVHENIVQIYQLGRRPDGACYIVMEFVAGLSLREFLRQHLARRRPVPVPLAVHMASRVARGLAYAHARCDAEGRPMGIVHRDICPNNILITTEGLTKITDFGVAKALPHRIIGDDWLTGKARYMAPEQAARRPVDFRADQYALGVVLFELLTGAPPRGEMADPHRDDFSRLPVPWERLPSGLGGDLIGILRRALDVDPAARYADTAEMARELELHIYRDGYGPTIQTVEGYLRAEFPKLYEARNAMAPSGRDRSVARDNPFVDPGGETRLDDRPGAPA